MKILLFPGAMLMVMVTCSHLWAQVAEFNPPAKASQKFLFSNSLFSFQGSRPGLIEQPILPTFSFTSQDKVAVKISNTHMTGFRLSLASPAAANRVTVSTLPFPTSGADAGSAQTKTTRPKAVQYSDGYYLRLKIHKYASFATLPLFVAEAVVGQKLYDDRGSGSLRGAHSGLAAGIAVLFGVNSVTGVWNLWDARKDPNAHTRRLVHGLLMLTAGAGFVATGALAPGEHEDRNEGTGGGRSTHRAVALTSMGIATVGYLYMLITR